jgi:DNA invertase Pin-like site-specific DNA recombinase
MSGQRVGYVRVSSDGQNPERQLDGVECDETFTDRASGKNADRPKLEEMLRFVRKGDTLIVHSMDRLARNLGDLRRLVERLTDRGVRVEFLHEHLVFSGEDSPMATLMLSVMGAVAEFERALIRERQREGIAVAKKNGVYRGSQRRLTTTRVAELRRRSMAGEEKAALAREFGISRQTLYRYLQPESESEAGIGT